MKKKPTPQEANPLRLTVKFFQDQSDALHAMAASQRVSVADVIRAAVQTHIERVQTLSQQKDGR